MYLEKNGSFDFNDIKEPIPRGLSSMEMELENKPIVLPEFKYYNGEAEDKCPYPKDDVRSNFWRGELMFSRLRNLEEQFKGYEEDVVQWRKYLLEHKPNQSARFLTENSNRQLCIALYIALLWGKWCPYDDQEWIVEY